VGVDVFDREKPIVFTYEEILASTDSFADANLLGHGTYGSVYYGVLRDQVRGLSCPVLCLMTCNCLINSKNVVFRRLR
jgi:hypothetical protein